jgi:hypothetical protein
MDGINNMMEMGKNHNDDSANTSVSLTTNINLSNLPKTPSNPTPPKHRPSSSAFPELNIQSWLFLLK